MSKLVPKQKFIKSLTPVTKNYFYGLVGNIIFGVVFEKDDKVTPKIAKQGKFVEHNGVKYLEIKRTSYLPPLKLRLMKYLKIQENYVTQDF